MQNEKEISKMAHKILRKRMTVAGVKTPPYRMGKPSDERGKESTCEKLK